MQSACLYAIFIGGLKVYKTALSFRALRFGREYEYGRFRSRLFSYIVKSVLFGGKDQNYFSDPCFPGYVFIESNKPTMEFMEDAFPVVYKLKDAYRFLCYSDKYDIAMRE